MDKFHEKDLAEAQKVSFSVQKLQDIASIYVKERLNDKSLECFKNSKNAYEYTDCVFAELNKYVERKRDLTNIGLFLEYKLMDCVHKDDDDNQSRICVKKVAIEVDQELAKLK